MGWVMCVVWVVRLVWVVWVVWGVPLVWVVWGVVWGVGRWAGGEGVRRQLEWGSRCGAGSLELSMTMTSTIQSRRYLTMAAVVMVMVVMVVGLRAMALWTAQGVVGALRMRRERWGREGQERCRCRCQPRP